MPLVVGLPRWFEQARRGRHLGAQQGLDVRQRDLHRLVLHGLSRSSCARARPIADRPPPREVCALRRRERPVLDELLHRARDPGDL